jgi:hypothetical protein
MAIALGSSAVAAAADAPAPAAIERCRAAHAGDSAAHIACLENALRNAGAAPGSEVGLDQVKQRERAQEDAPQPVSDVRIVGVDYDSRGFGTFRTADGQVWRETEAGKRKPRLAQGSQYAARIEHGKVGGYRMYVDGIKWMFKVERLE